MNGGMTIGNEPMSVVEHNVPTELMDAIRLLFVADRGSQKAIQLAAVQGLTPTGTNGAMDWASDWSGHPLTYSLTKPFKAFRLTVVSCRNRCFLPTSDALALYRARQTNGC